MVKKHTSGFAIASLILGLLGVWGIGSILAIIFGAVALNQIKKDKNLGGEGMAKWGLALGIIGLIVYTIIFASLGTLFGIGSLISATDATGYAVVDNSENSEIKDSEISTKQQEDQPEENEPEQKIKSATINIDKVQIQLANLYPIRVTVANTGDVTVRPKFDIYVYDSGDNEVCYGSPMIDEFTSIYSGNDKTGELTLMGCMFTKDGTYTLKIELLDSDYNKLDTDTKDFSVDYWDQFNL
ncbi:MAG: DUF4190 domain-containing protein [Candidatus Woesearchaeota archaeon]